MGVGDKIPVTFRMTYIVISVRPEGVVNLHFVANKGLKKTQFIPRTDSQYKRLLLAFSVV